MSTLLLDPHGDDAVLFCCYTLLREKPQVVVTHRTVPQGEIAEALTLLGITYDWVPPRELPEKVIAPAWHHLGHDEHNQAFSMFEPDLCYLTYAPRAHRQTNGTEVVPTADEIALKLRALSCFRSQIEQPSTRPWFFELLDMREWVA